MAGSRYLLQSAPDGRADDTVVAVCLLMLVAATLALVAKALVHTSSHSSAWNSSFCGSLPLSRLSSRMFQRWDIKPHSSTQISDDVRVQLGAEASKCGMPAAAQQHGSLQMPDRCMDSQPLSGWIRSLRPIQGYALVQNSAPNTPSRRDAGAAADAAAANPALAPELASQCGEMLQCVTPTKLAPHPELPRIRVTIPSPTLRQKHCVIVS